MVLRQAEIPQHQDKADALQLRVKARMNPDTRLVQTAAGARPALITVAARLLPDHRHRQDLLQVLAEV